ncbi:MAG: hypothetical protein ACJ8FL_04290 [Sphingomicrobium sp.]
MQNVISWVAIGCAILCLLVYLGLMVKLVLDSKNKTSEARELLPHPREGLVGGVSAKDFAEIVKGLASLVDSLVKAGPALWSLIGSLLFLLIAALAAGVFSSSP